MPHDNVASADPAKVQGSKSILWVFVVCHNQCRRFPCGFVCHRVLLKRQAYGIRHDVSNVLQSASWMHVYRSLQVYVYLLWSDRIPFMQKFNSGWDDSDRACLVFLFSFIYVHIIFKLLSLENNQPAYEKTRHVNHVHLTTSARPVGCRMQIRSLSSSLKTRFFDCDYLHHLVRAIIYFSHSSILTILMALTKV